MNRIPDTDSRASGPNVWIPPIICLGLLVALALSTTRVELAGNTPILWFVLLTILAVRMRRDMWASVLYMPAFVLFVTWFFGAAQWVSLPFALGLLIAYVLAPVVDILERRMSRSAAIAVLAGPTIAVLVLLGILLVPAVFTEGSQLVASLPELKGPIEQSSSWLQERARRFGYNLEVISLADLFLPHLEQIGSNLLGAGAGLWRGVQSVIGFVSFLVITPVVGYYLLRDFNKLQENAVEQFPSSAREGVETFVRQVDSAVSAYLRGQLLLGVVGGFLFTIGLTLLGMDYAILVGISAVFLSLIPFLGSALTAALAVAVALLSDPSWISVVKVGALYVAIQAIDSVITPRIMSQSMALHPVFVMLAVLIAGQFFGLIGVFIAVPAAATLKGAFVVWAPQLLELLSINRDR